MNKDELIVKINSVQDVLSDRRTIYEVLTELGITFKRTNCRRCLNDLYNICREELGLIGSAAESSDFNGPWLYAAVRPTSWRGFIVSAESDQDTLSEFCARHPDYCKPAGEVIISQE